jgi:hypothetical protein
LGRADLDLQKRIDLADMIGGIYRFEQVTERFGWPLARAAARRAIVCDEAALAPAPPFLGAWTGRRTILYKRHAGTPR